MENRVVIKPGWIGSFALWAGSDQYSFAQALKRSEFSISQKQITNIYVIEANSLVGLGGTQRFAIEYNSGKRDCLVTVDEIPEDLLSREKVVLHPIGAAVLFMRSCWKEPTALLLPLALPVVLAAMMVLFQYWNDYVLHNQDILTFFAKPGCDENCVRKVLSIHSLVVLLFLLQFVILFLPLGLLFFHAPKYKSAFNYRLMQTYSLATVLVGAIIFVQLVVFFPFRQYGKFVGLGFDPKVERLLSNLKVKK